MELKWIPEHEGYQGNEIRLVGSTNREPMSYTKGPLSKIWRLIEKAKLDKVLACKLGRVTIDPVGRGDNKAIGLLSQTVICNRVPQIRV